MENIKSEFFKNDLERNMEKYINVEGNGNYLLDLVELSRSPENSSKNSSQEQASCDKSEERQDRSTAQLNNKLPKFKAQSCQDIASAHCKKKYDHVESKVKQYIANLKEEEKRSRDLQIQGQLIRRPRSQPESVNVENNEELGNVDTRLLDKLFKKEKENMEIRKFNEYLQSQLKEKLALVARLKRNSDLMRIELLKMQDKLYNSVIKTDCEGNIDFQSYSKRIQKPKQPFLRDLIFSEPVNSYATEVKKISTATQTNPISFWGVEKKKLKNVSQCHEKGTIRLDDGVSYRTLNKANRRSISPTDSQEENERINHIERDKNVKLHKKKKTKNLFRKSNTYIVNRNDSYKTNTRRRNRWRKWLLRNGNLAATFLCCKETESCRDDFSYSELNDRSSEEESFDITLFENI